MHRFITRLLLISATLLFAGCGGGGGGNIKPEYYETPEYHRQGGLGLIKASSVYARGGTGRGVTVGVVDTGASPDHPDLNYASVDGFDGYEHTDTNGHGTHVAGIIAARKDDSEMHGVAYEARIASYAIVFTDSEFDAQIADGIGKMTEQGVGIINNSWGATVPIADRDFDRDYVINFYSKSVDAYQRYAETGGVQVWAAGNGGYYGDGYTEVSLQAGLPYFFPELEKGWIAVVSIGLDGDLAWYSQPCGVAADWCVAAPGGDSDEDYGIYSTWLDGQYKAIQGTSMAAPQVAGAMAVLKSLFPNLSFQQVRDRILVTANDTGIYADESIYGQGLLDLDGASQPLGGTSFALAGYDHGRVVTTDGARITLSAGALARYLDERNILILDNFQRAPFLVPISAFAVEDAGYLSLRDLGLAAPERTWADERDERLGLTITGSDFQANGVSNGAWFLGGGAGAGVMEGLAGLVGASLPHSDYRMSPDAVGMALGFDSGMGEFYASAATGANGTAATGPGFGIRSWAPRSVVSASFIPTGADYAIGASFASGLNRPSGWEGAGAFATSGDSIDVAYSRSIVAGDSVRVGLTSRVTHLSPDDSALVRFDDALITAAEVDLQVKVTRNLTLNARAGLERPVAAGKGTLRVADSIDESGRIAYDDITIDQADFLGFEKVGLNMQYSPAPNSTYGAGVMAVWDAFGEMDAVVGVRAELRY